MKQPKISELVIDHAGTKKLRSQLKNAKKVKITIHIEAVSSGSKRNHEGQSPVPYTRILTQLLNESSNQKAISRLDRIEKELKKLKRKIAA